jgi:hypothetical protein
MIRQVLGRPDAPQMVEVIEKLIAMKNADEDRSARKEFEQRFSAMQKLIPEITPDKQVKRRNGARMYDYASLPYLKKIIDPIAHDHGFSYYWSQADSPDGKMRTIFHLCNCGYERQNWFQSETLDPITSRDGDAVTNVVQAARGTESYQKRATFIDGFGLTILGEDNDASTLEIDEELKKTLAEIESAASIDDLLTANKKAMAKYNNSPNEITFILGTYAQARKRLTGAGQ